MGRRVLMVAGEASGDAQGATLARALRERAPDIELYGVGGPAMRAAGVRTIVDSAELSIMGLSEAVAGIGRVVGCYRRLAAEIRSEDAPSLVVPIDFPELNMRVARAAKRAGVPVLYYVCPQVWAWRRHRIAALARSVDRMIVLFPFEAELFRERGVDAHFVGHPLAEAVRASRPLPETRARYGADGDCRLLALLPGSRRKEVTALLPDMLEAVRLLGDGVRAVVARAPGLHGGLVESIVEASGLDVAIAEGDTYDVVAASDAALVASGTATVECALLGCPMAVVYRMSRFTHAVARALVRVDFIAMPNIILNRAVVPELVQDGVTPAAMAAAMRGYFDSEERSTAVRRELMTIADSLVQPGAARRAADLALELVS